MIKKLILNGIIFVFVVIGVLFIALPFMQNRLVNHLSYYHMSITPDQIQQNLVTEVEFDFAVVESIGLPNILEAMYEEHVPTIGEIIIPAVDLHLPIIRGISDAGLAIGAGTMRADQVKGEGNYALASHRMRNPDLLFSPLERVEFGDEVFLRDLHNIYIYRVSEIKVIAPERVEVIKDQEQRTLLTLITCTEDGLERLMVRGDFVQRIAIEDESEEFEVLARTVPTIQASIIASAESGRMPKVYLEIVLVVIGAILLGVGVVIISSKSSKPIYTRNKPSR